MKKILSVVILAVCLLGASAQEALQYSVQHYSVSDGLSQNTVMTILQDRDGFMWFGTWDGLNRFDGLKFKKYKPSLSGEHASNNRIDYLYEDSLGFIWMRAYDGAFYRLDKHTDRILATNIRDTRFGNRLQSKHLLLEQEKGIIWLSGDNRLLCIRENDRRKHTDETEQTAYTLHGEANFLLTDADHRIWAGTAAGLECISGDQVCYCPGNRTEDNNFLSAMADGKDLWIGSESGLFWHYTAGNQHFDEVLDCGSPILNVVRLDDYALLLTTDGAGFFVYDVRSGESRCFSQKTEKGIRSDSFTNVYVDAHGDAWLINSQLGIWRYRNSDASVQHYTMVIDERFINQLDRNFFAFEDDRGHLWVNPYGGGFSCYVPEKDAFMSPLAGVSNMIHSAYMDRKGSLWIGSYDLGLDRVDVTPLQFHLSDLRSDNQHSGELRAICQLRNGDILEATKDGVIRRYSADDKLLSQEQYDGRVYSILETPDGNVLYGTRGDGIVSATGKHVLYCHKDDDRYSLLCNDVYDMLYAPNGDLWVATYGGGVNVLRGGKFIHQSNDWHAYPDNFGAKVRNIAFVNDTTLWAATTSGLLRINTRTLATRQTPYYDLRCVYAAADGRVWVGTFGGGLLCVKDPMADDVFGADNAAVYTTQNGLLSDIVLSIVGDKDGSIWFTFEDGISRYKDGAFQHFSALSQMSHASFSEAKGIRLQNGDILFGQTLGSCTFSPSKIVRSNDCPPIRFTDFLVFNKSVNPGDNGPLDDNICYETRVSLRHSESVFTIEYVALDYANFKDIKYAYKMDGVDDDWNYVEGETRATYTNLPAGDYTFRVRSTNAQGEWVDNERTLTVHVKALFWLSPWAFLIYALLATALLWQLYRVFSSNSKLRQEVEVEQKVTDIKLRFFTNISHELRTPLTLITGPVENILQNEKLSPAVRTQLEIVSSNATRMLRLINQILDFRKIQNNKMKLRVQSTNLASLAQETCNNFLKEASDKHITFSFQNDAVNPMAWVDRDKTDTIIYNLLSNAFKFTPAGQSIRVRVAEKGEFVLVSVADTGVGIPKDKRSVLFDRFASNNEINTPSDKPGTGIGLNLVKELVDLHHGYIEVESEYGKGSTFTVMLRRDKDHFDSGVEVVVDDLVLDTNADRKVSLDVAEQHDPHLKTVLVVDDNDDMRVFLRSILSNEYNVFAAGDGQEAIAIAEQNDLDIIITDLMMPNMDGLELTNHLKTDMKTSHLPVVLLTAKSAIESRLAALQYGADDYITKPFSPEYLLARIDNILRQRDRLQETYRSTLGMTVQPEKEKPLTPNEIFLNQLNDFMLRNMDNNELSVDDMVREMSLGRTVFFNKLKGLTGLSPVEYIRDVRIKRAAELLLDDRYNITEVTYMVGMNDSRYFAKCFKAVYGVTPSEYKKQNEKKKSDRKEDKK